MKKSNKLEHIRERIIYFADNHCVSRIDFQTNTGIKKGMFDAKDIERAVGSDKLSNILDSYRILNPDWLITGKGEMLLHPKLYDIDNDSSFAHTCVNEPLAKPIEFGSNKQNAIPLVSSDAIAGFGNMEFAIQEQDIQSFYSVPDFVNIDYMIRVNGSSMYPKYNSGDVVACRIIRESQFIQWNKVHVLATKEQGILIKRLKKGGTPECLLAISDNKDYDPFEIPTDEITGMALVIGVIRLE